MGSRDADIDFTFTRPTTVRAVLDVLTARGWSAVEPVGHVSYMVNDEDDSYEWYDSTPGHIDEVLMVLDAKANLPYTVALNVYHAEAKTGGMLMFHMRPHGCIFHSQHRPSAHSLGTGIHRPCLVSGHTRARPHHSGTQGVRGPRGALLTASAQPESGAVSPSMGCPAKISAPNAERPEEVARCSAGGS